MIFAGAKSEELRVKSEESASRRGHAASCETRASHAETFLPCRVRDVGAPCGATRSLAPAVDGMPLHVGASSRRGIALANSIACRGDPRGRPTRRHVSKTHHCVCRLSRRPASRREHRPLGDSGDRKGTPLQAMAGLHRGGVAGAGDRVAPQARRPSQRTGKRSPRAKPASL